MGLAQYDHMVQTLPAYAADNALAVRILPGRRGRDEDFVDLHAFESLLEVVAVDARDHESENVGSPRTGEH